MLPSTHSFSLLRAAGLRIEDFFESPSAVAGRRDRTGRRHHLHQSCRRQNAYFAKRDNQSPCLLLSKGSSELDEMRKN